MEGKTFFHVNLVTLIIELNFTFKSNFLRRITRKKSEALEPRLAHSCRCLSRFLQHETARNISTSPGRDASPSQITSLQFVRFPHQFAGTHLYTWVERGTVRVKCLSQEHNTMSPARAQTRTAHSGVEHTNHEATLPPTITIPE